jgi:membrane-associated protease RseP (regulator of RpoE activity)
MQENNSQTTMFNSLFLRLPYFNGKNKNAMAEKPSVHKSTTSYVVSNGLRLGLIVALLLLSFVTNSNGQSSSNAGMIVHAGIIFRLDQQLGTSVFVDSIMSNSPAALSGIQKGDKLIAVNGIAADNDEKSINKINQLMRIPVNSSISLEIERSEEHKKTKRLTYVLEGKIAPPPVVRKKVFGIGVTLAIDSIFNDGKPSFASQVQLVYVGSPAAKAGIQAGDYIIAVDHNPINDSRTDVISQLIELLLIDEPKPASLQCLRYEQGHYSMFQVDLIRADISGYINMNAPLQTNQVQPKPSFPDDDRDGDGIKNIDDACPNEAGQISLNPFENGCPAK